MILSFPDYKTTCCGVEYLNFKSDWQVFLGKEEAQLDSSTLLGVSVPSHPVGYGFTSRIVSW